MENRKYSAAYNGYQIIWDVVDKAYWIYDKITHQPVESAITIEYAQLIIDNWSNDFSRVPTELLEQLMTIKRELGITAYLAAVKASALLTGCSCGTIDDQVKKYTLNLK